MTQDHSQLKHLGIRRSEIKSQIQKFHEDQRLIANSRRNVEKELAATEKDLAKVKAKAVQQWPLSD